MTEKAAKNPGAKPPSRAQKKARESGAEAQSSPADALLAATLTHVPFDGWSDAAIATGAADCGMEPHEAAAIFPHGAVSAIDAFTAKADRDMVAAFMALGEDEKPRGITATVRCAILIRLANAAPHREAVASSLKFLKTPRHAALAARILYRSVDGIWRLTGDKAVDFSFYSKRATLSAIYSATLLYWAGNPQAGDDAVERFLDKRLGELKYIPKVTAPAKKAIDTGMRMAARILERMPVREAKP